VVDFYVMLQKCVKANLNSLEQKCFGKYSVVFFYKKYSVALIKAKPDTCLLGGKNHAFLP
jgi:hypothetical protein